jgi:uncharacterized iron-regulated membrane protein
MAWLHTWCGLLAGWILFSVFLTGTASYYRQEISAWMRPELHRGVAQAEAAERAVSYLQQVGPAARTWLIELPDARNRAIRVGWSNRDGPGGFSLATLDAEAGTPAAVRKTSGGDLFYYFHFDLLVLPFRLGRWLVSLCAMAMLVAIISGVITHRRIFVDFFTFRPRKGGQRAWLDGHNAVAVLALPYHLMITYTGLVTFALMLLPWGVDLAYRGDRSAFQSELFGFVQPGPATGETATLAPIVPMLEQATRHWGGGLPGRITVTNPNNASARVMVARGETDRVAITRQTVLFEGDSGHLLSARDKEGPAEQTWGVMYGLHLARFASPALRVLFFLSGLAGTTMVATGLVLWVVKRRVRAPGWGVRIAGVLNVATIAGLPCAMLALLWANRLLPVDLPQRDVWEFRSYFGVWSFGLLCAVLCPSRLAWRFLFGLAALLSAGLPVLNALTTNVHLGVTLRQGDWALAGVDLTVAALAPAFALLAWRAGRSPAAQRLRRLSVADAA